VKLRVVLEGAYRSGQVLRSLRVIRLQGGNCSARGPRARRGLTCTSVRSPSVDRQGSRLGQGSPPQLGVYRVSQAFRQGLPPPHTAIYLILDNHSARISRETRAWLADQLSGRFEFTFTPKHGSWLNLVEGFFPSPPVRCCATSASHRSTNSRTRSWSPWSSSTRTPWFTPGLISSTRRRDMIQTSKSMT
jgi:hypothetical protein